MRPQCDAGGNFRTNLTAAMETVDYDRRLFEVYGRGQVLSPKTLDTWLQAFSRRLPRTRPLTILDLGAGIGRFSPALAERFGGPVIGVEPSAKMRSQAEEHAAHPQVSYLGGCAEDIPVEGDSVDTVLLFLVWHLVRDRCRAAAELARVLHRGGTVLLRITPAERMPELWWYQHFQRARELEREISLSLSEIVGGLAAAGLHFVCLDEIYAETAPNRHVDLERLRLRSRSVFEHTSEEEASAAFHAISAALESSPECCEPVISRNDLLTFRKL
jgi:ubiquinone/menaquinone biosynthesis C-methylase UbiE